MKFTPMGTAKSHTSIPAMELEVAEWCEAKGWADDNRTFGDELILIASELLEALEAFRVSGYEEWTTYQPTGITLGGVPVKMPKMTETQLRALFIMEEKWGEPRREGVAPELAGTFVRLLDSCGRHGISLGDEFRKEMDYNWNRTFRHGGKAL